MGKVEDAHGSQYSPFVAFIYLFNLMVGTGCLALPSVLLKGGWFLGGFFIIIVAFLSYVSVTFILESMATANALIRLQSKGGLEEHSLLREECVLPRGDGTPKAELHLTPTTSDRQLFHIARRTELGEMAGLFFNQWGIILFYTTLILYLIGDSVIYSTLVARSLALFFSNLTPASWAFDLYLGIFFCFSLPLCFFDFQKTKHLQITTLAIRNISLYTMIGLAAMKLFKGGRQDVDVPGINIPALPNLFGGAVYSFMCHHSLPGIITPMRDKSHLQRILAFAFGSVILVYLLLFITSGLAFGSNIMDPLTFNFPPEQYGFVGDMLFLFPVFTLSSSFPMLSITLRNNLDILMQHVSQKVRRGPSTSDTVVPNSVRKNEYRRVMLTLLAVVPSTVLCYIAEHADISVDELVGLTGAFAGCAVMLIIPACLVYCSRRVFADAYSAAWDHQKGASKFTIPKNIHHSPFGGHLWVFAILAWAGLSLVFNTFEEWEKSPTP